MSVGASPPQTADAEQPMVWRGLLRLFPTSTIATARAPKAVDRERGVF